jgi:hypothetical protein
MANINQPTLILFEDIRRELDYTPPANSNEVFSVGSGNIVLQTLRDNQDDYRFDIRIQNRSVDTGIGEFYISGECNNKLRPYRRMYINSAATFNVTERLSVSNTSNDISLNPLITNDGTMVFKSNSIINIGNGVEVVNTSIGILNIEDNVKIIIGNNNASFKIYGTINISYSSVRNLLANPKIIIDNSTIVNILGLPTGRLFSLTDYIADLRKKYQNQNTIGSRYISDSSRVTYYWKAGDPLQPSDVLSLVVETGTSILGDFTVPLVGMPEHIEQFMQTLSDLTISRFATLYIGDSYNGSTYISPLLYITEIPGNSANTGFCNVDGTIIVDGQLSSINVDRGAYIRIKETGKIILTNGGKIINSNNSDESSLYINGSLIIDDISQLEGFDPKNIEFGINGKLIILNTNNTDDKKILFSTPNGILTSELYRLFKDRLIHIEYHIQNNDGIRIDEFNNGYELSNWYGGMRLEKAVKLGYIIWHDGAYIELDKSIVPWVDDDSTLSKVGRLFNVFGDTDQKKLQSAIERLIYAGFDNIVFRFISGNNVKDITLTLESCYIKTALYNNSNKRYKISATNSGSMFIRNNINSADTDDIINTASKVYNINNPEKTEFLL